MARRPRYTYSSMRKRFSRFRALVALVCVAIAGTAALSACSSSSGGSSGSSHDAGQGMADSGDATAQSDAPADGGALDGTQGDGTTHDATAGGDANSSGPDGPAGEGAPPDSGPPLNMSICGSDGGALPNDAGPVIILSHVSEQFAIDGPTPVYRWADRILVSGTLWDVTTGLQITNGTWDQSDPNGGVTVAAGFGVYLQDVASTSNGVNIHSMTDGSLLGFIPALAITPPFTNFALDGSYIWSVSGGELAVWGTNGAQELLLSSGYGSSKVAGLPGKVLIANGGKGPQVIETVTLAGGASTTSSNFIGNFVAWFVDGSHFVTSFLSNSYVYSADAQLVEVVTNQAVAGGIGGYFWTNPTSQSIDVYALESSDGGVVDGGGPVVFSDSNTNALTGPFTATVNGQEVIAVTPSQITSTTYPTPSGGAASASVDSNGLLAVGTNDGLVYYQGTTASPTQSGLLGCGLFGPVVAIKGSSSGTVAVATARYVLVIDVPSSTLTHALPISATAVVLSSDGKTLLAQVGTTLQVYDLPTETQIATYPAGTLPKTSPAFFSTPFNMNSTGTRLGQLTASSPPQALVTDLGGTTTYLTAPGGLGPPIISPSGDNVAVSYAPTSMSTVGTTALYTNGTLVATTPGAGVLWFDDTHLGSLQPSSCSGCGGSYIYDNMGNLLSTVNAVGTIPDDISALIGTTRLFDNYGPYWRIGDISTDTIVETIQYPPNPVVSGTFSPLFGTLAGPYILTSRADWLMAVPY